MIDNRLHRVPVRLKTRDLVWEWEDHLIEINELRAWLDQITEWQPDMYELQFHNNGSRCVAWFADERHAVLCALRWS